MKEKEITKKIWELQKELNTKQKNKEKKIVILEWRLNIVLYILIFFILVDVFDGMLFSSIYNPFATIPSIIGALTILFGLSFILMVLIRAVFFGKNKK